MEVLSKMERHEFAVYKEEVEVSTKMGKKTYTLLPLSGRFYRKFIGLVKKFPQNEGATNEEFMNSLDEETIGSLHELVFETLKFSLNVKKEEEDQLDRFVSQNLFAFIPGLVSVNMGSEDGSGN